MRAPRWGALPLLDLGTKGAVLGASLWRADGWGAVSLDAPARWAPRTAHRSGFAVPEVDAIGALVAVIRDFEGRPLRPIFADAPIPEVVSIDAEARAALIPCVAPWHAEGFERAATGDYPAQWRALRVGGRLTFAAACDTQGSPFALWALSRG